MSREVKRVPLNFNAPRETWGGYINPYHLPDCPDCNGCGWTAAHEWLNAISTVLSTLGETAATGRDLHPYAATLMNAPVVRDGRTEYTAAAKVRDPSPDLVEFLAGISSEPPERAGQMFGIDSHRIAAGLVKAAGLPDTWGWCPTCNGSGHAGTPEQVAEQEAWEPTEPPTGEGWQLWETVSEGSPITPVFGTAEELARHIASGEYGFGGSRVSLEAARALVSSGWAPSAVVMGGTLYRAEEANLAMSKQNNE